MIVLNPTVHSLYFDSKTGESDHKLDQTGKLNNESRCYPIIEGFIFYGAII
jgi:hypothetical protein